MFCIRSSSKGAVGLIRRDVVTVFSSSGDS